MTDKRKAGHVRKISVYVPLETKENFDKTCDDYGVSHTSAIRMLIKDWSDGHIKNKHNTSPFE